MFNCDKCSLCCRNIGSVDELSHLDDGTGTCIQLDLETELCKIYEDRPLVCSVDRYHETVKDEYTLEQWYEVNTKACEDLKKDI